MGRIELEAETSNRAHWDEVAPVHLKSYRIDDLLAGISHIDEIQKRDLYPVKAKDLIHLQCHIGTDTLSLAMDGANVTGVDFSPKSIAIAKELATKMKIQAHFLEANVLNLKGIISKKFDIVYTSKGVLSWISDIEMWASTIAYLLKGNGTFYILEGHPASFMFDETRDDSLQIKYPYFHQKEPIFFNDDHPDYSDKSYVPANKTYQWIWTISDVVNALIRNGLRIESLDEYDKTFYQAFPRMVKTKDGWWILRDNHGMIPLSFSLRARKAD